MPDPEQIDQDAPIYAEVALPLPLRQTFTYRLPVDIAPKAKPGARLQVAFGRRAMIGYIVELHRVLDPAGGLDESAVKDAQRLLEDEPLVTPEILNLSRWTADYYAASWGEILKASLPAGINSSSEAVISITEAGRLAELRITNMKPIRARMLKLLAEVETCPQRHLEKEFGAAAAKRAIRQLLVDELVLVAQREKADKVKAKMQKAVRLNKDASSTNGELSAGQQKILDLLRESGGEMLFTELVEVAGGSASPINTLAKHGYVEVSVQEVRRTPYMGGEIVERGEIDLNPEQIAVLDEIEASLGSDSYEAFLLHGVTGSGKTEVYIRAMQAVLKLGKTALMLVPEIALTPVFSRRLREKFGDDVAILHSNLSPGERFDEWRRIRSGEARVAIGTRSAVFAPLQNIGLIVVDEEHDTSYRQNDSPFYNARDVAVMRANQAGAVVILGSATPAMETFYNAQNGKYRYLQMGKRIGDRPLAVAELVDMREVFRTVGKDILLSPQLTEAIRETYARRQQSIILLNRRGFSSFVLCRTCGETLRCRNCDITLTYHKRDSRLTCHYCSFNVNTPKACPFCKSEFLYFIGEGTEQLEDVLKARFPELRIARIDRDTMSKKDEITKTLLAFDRGELDMLVGTQMLAKGHDFHNVTLVGVISVDLGLGLPDFRSAERTFQLLTQVAGRAGRGDLRGRVLIQTYYPEHYALRHAVRQDYEGFYKEEQRFRERLSYPPFVVLASILIKHKDERSALRNAEILKNALERSDEAKRCRILGVAQASIARIKNEYRFQILIKSVSRKALRETLEKGLDLAESSGCDMRTVFAEIDPVNLM